MPNNGDGTVSVLDGASLTEIARVPAGADITGVNTAWFETVAFVLSRGDRKATVIELEQGRSLGEIILPGAPEAAVDDRRRHRLYVALGDVGGVAVIDVRERRLLKVIDGVAVDPGVCRWRARSTTVAEPAYLRQDAGGSRISVGRRCATFAGGRTALGVRLPDDLDATPPPAHHHSGARTRSWRLA